MLNRQSLAQVSKQFDWSSYIHTHHTVKRGSDSELRICCMNCGDTKYKLYVNTEKGVFQCFKCSFRTGKKYNLVDFIAQTEHISKAAATDRVKELSTQIAPSEDDIREKLITSGDEKAAQVHHDVKTILLPSGLQPLTHNCRIGVGQEYWDYLLGRGLTEKEVLAGNVHFTSCKHLLVYDSKNKLRGDLANRVVWPVYGKDHKIVSYQARVIDPRIEPKYLAAPDSELAHTLWPFLPPREGRAYLVEGILDAYAGHRLKQSFYSCFGKKVSYKQIDLLKAWGTKEVVVFFDKSDAYWEIVQAVEVLKMHFPKVLVLDNSSWPSEVDPGDCLKLPNGSELLQEAIDNPVDVYSISYEKWKLSAKSKR